MLQQSDMNRIVRNFLNTLPDGLYVIEGERLGAYNVNRSPTMIQVSWHMIDTVYEDVWCENEHGEACYRLHVNGKPGDYPLHVNTVHNREVLWARTVLRSFPDLTTGDILGRVTSVPATPDVSWTLLLQRHPLAPVTIPKEAIHAEEGHEKDGSAADEVRAGETSSRADV